MGGCVIGFTCSTLDGEGKIMDIEPFMDNTSFNNIIDIGSYSIINCICWSMEQNGLWEYGCAFNYVSITKKTTKNRWLEAKGPDKFRVLPLLNGKLLSKETVDPDGDKVTYELVIGDQTLKIKWLFQLYIR